MSKFQFTTDDSTQDVIAYYKDSMLKTYGFLGEWSESPLPGTTVIHFARRALRDTWVFELVTVTVTSEGAGPTTVNVDLEVQPAP